MITRPTRDDIAKASDRYRAACRQSNSTLGRGGEQEVADLLSVRDSAYALIHLYELDQAPAADSAPLVGELLTLTVAPWMTPELQAMGFVETIMKNIPADERARIARWVAERFGATQ